MPANRPPRSMRLDELVVERGLAPSRSRAHALILAGKVRSGTTRLDKPGRRVRFDVDLYVEVADPWVGRGAHKLIGAFEAFDLDVTGRVAIDVGSSTGGFTQVLLARGAARVHAIDVGRGQLDWSLRNDPRVDVREGVNARYLEPHDFAESPAVGVVDVAFISLDKILPPLSRVLAAESEIVALVKPQFEAGRERVGRGGIVTDPATHREVLTRIVARSRELEWEVAGLRRSPIRGADGNVEFLLYLRRPPGADAPLDVASRIDDALASSEESAP